MNAYAFTKFKKIFLCSVVLPWSVYLVTTIYYYTYILPIHEYADCTLFERTIISIHVVLLCWMLALNMQSARLNIKNWVGYNYIDMISVILNYLTAINHIQDY